MSGTKVRQMLQARPVRKGATVLLNVARFDHLWVEPYAEYHSQELQMQAR